MKKINLRGSLFYYEDIRPDRSPTIVMIHGHPFDHSMWQYQYDALKEYRLIVPDLKGYGRSDYQFEKIYIEEQALDIALMLDALGLPDVHLIGLSMGGQIIVEFARLFPHRVNSLIICASSPTAETQESYQHRLQLANYIESVGMEQYTREDIHKYLHPDTVKAECVVYAHLFKMMADTKTEGAVASHRGRAERRDNTLYLKEMMVPSLIVAGEQDYFFPVATLQELADQMPNAVFRVIEGAGHLPNMEQPDNFNRAILHFYRHQLLTRSAYARRK